MMCGLLKSRSETRGVFSTVLVKEMQRFRKKHCDGEINRQRKEKDSVALEGGTGRLTQREEQKCFRLPAPSFSQLPSSSISISLHIQFFFLSPVFSPLLFSTSRVVRTRLVISYVRHYALCSSPERMNDSGFSKEHLAISQHFSTLTHSAQR